MTVFAAVLAVCGVFGAILYGLRRQHAQLAAANAELARQLREAHGAQMASTIDTVVTLAGQRLDSERREDRARAEGSESRIDLQLRAMRGELDQVTTLVKQLENARSQQYGTLAQQIAEAGRQTRELAETTHELREALSSSRARGQWGERMAEDVLELAGLIEGVNYHKQQRLDDGGVPDFTFVLPRGLQLHMDVKFPLDNYLRYLEADCDPDRERFRRGFLRDARERVKELAGRGYCDTQAALDCVLLFIPNEQLFGFIHEHDPALVDDALRRRLVLCSPLTLFAVLAVIRQAVDNFRLERTTDQILSLLAEFRTQWEKFGDELEKLGVHLARSQKTFDALCTTRRRQLERPLDKLEELRQERATSDREVPQSIPGLRAVGDGG